MHRVGNLWDQVTSFQNLHRAAYQVLRGKRDQICAGEFFIDLEKCLFKLQEELVSGEYIPGSYRTFWIREPKLRMISAAPFRDRIVHHALINVIEPVYEKSFIFHSYACRKGKGTHRALERFIGLSRSYKYVLKMDIRKFFPSIDHEILKGIVRRIIKDPIVLRLCDTIIDNSNPQEDVVQYFPGDDLFTPLQRRRGIPIGNLTSQFFGNVYLDALDHYVIERLGVGPYLRYVDDFCIFGNNKHVLQNARQSVRESLFGLRLRLNEGKSRIRQVKEGIEFLGFVTLPLQTRLNRTAVRRQRVRVASLQHGFSCGMLDWTDVAASLQAWNAHAEFGTTSKLRDDVFRGAVFKRSWNYDTQTPISGFGFARRPCAGGDPELPDNTGFPFPRE